MEESQYLTLISKQGLTTNRDILRLESKFDSVTQLLSNSSAITAAAPTSASGSPITAVFTEPLTPEAQLMAYKMFELYHIQMMPLFPFVWVSLDESPEKLFRERPMLYMAIIVVACQQNVDAQQELAQRWREELGRRIWAQGEKSLHLLQGILVYLAWYASLSRHSTPTDSAVGTMFTSSSVPNYITLCIQPCH